jgi:pyrroline-5-carboxylate reductase
VAPQALPQGQPTEEHSDVPAAVGVLGVGALASAMVLALQRAWPDRVFHLSPRNAAAVAELLARVGAVPHSSNQQVADACRMLVIGVRPAQLQTLAAEVRFSARHHLLVLSAGTPLAGLQALFAPARVTRLMTGLAVAADSSALSCYPPDAAVQSLWAPACAAVVAFDDEAQFEASVLAVCANAWWLDQLHAMSQWLVDHTGMQPAQARTLLAANMADVAQMLALNPDKSPAAIARFIGSPGTYTGAGLDHLQTLQAHQPWVDVLALLAAQMGQRDGLTTRSQ